MANLIGAPVSLAVRALDRAGLKVRSFRYEEREDVADRTVVEVQPQAGAVVRLFDAIVLTLATTPKTGPRAMEDTGSRIVHLSIDSPPGLTRREGQLRIDRGDAVSSYAFDFLLAPGENPELAVWMPFGAEAVLVLDGQEIWRKNY
jgi:hypothetical protein